MKKFKIILIFLVLVCISGFIFFISCEEKVNDLESDSNVKSTEFYIDDKVVVVRTFECSGSCVNGRSCAILTDIETNITQCSCEGCKLEIQQTHPNYEFKMDMISISNYLNDYIYNSHLTFDFGITSMKFTACNNIEYLEIQYVIESNNSKQSEDIFSVVFVTEYATANQIGGKTLIVDCTGSCPDGSCVEAIDLEKGNVFCKCQSDNCKMKISEVPAAYVSDKP